MFRLPEALVDPQLIDPYCLDDCVGLSTADGYLVLTITLCDDEGASQWIEGHDLLSRLVPLRNDLLMGDTRALYLAWLANVESFGLAEDELEPPVPAGLGKLDPPLKRLAHFLEIDQNLLRIAAVASAEPFATPDHVLRDTVARLPRGECDDLLWRLAQGEPNLRTQLLRRLDELIGAPPSADRPRRTVGELLAARDHLDRIEEQKRQKAAEARRKAELEALAQREPAVWQEVDRLIKTYQANAYQQSVALLLQLRDLADYMGTRPAFQARLDQIRTQYGRRPSLMASLQSAGLTME
jgi:hypothetical protein